MTLSEGSLPVLFTTSALLHLCTHLLFILGRVGWVERLLLRDLNETSTSNIACKGGQVSPSLPVLSQSHTLIAAPKVVERTSGRLQPVSPHHPCLSPFAPSATSGEASGPAMNKVCGGSAVRCVIALPGPQRCIKRSLRRERLNQGGSDTLK